MSENAEQLLISSMLQTQKMFAPEDKGITYGHFHSYSAEYEWLLKYQLEYKQPPSKAAFRTAFPDFPLVRSDDMDYAVESVKESHLAYAVTKVVKEGLRHLRGGNPQEALGFLYKNVTTLANSTDAPNRTKDFVSNWSEHFDHVLDLVNTPDDMKCVLPYGYPTLDERTNGHQPGSLALFAARLGQGKTWNLVHSGVEALLKGKKVLVYSLEMPARQIEARFMACLAKRLGAPFTHHQIHTGRGLDLIAYKQFLGQMKDLGVTGNLHIYDVGRGKASAMTIAAALAEEGADLVLVDYITLLNSTTGGKSLDGWQTAGQISAELKEVALRFATPIFAAAQINREGERPNPWKPPQAKNLSQSDNLGQDADVVITMKRSSKGTSVYSLEKNRHGEDGFKWHSKFLANTGEFTEITYDTARDLADHYGEMDPDE